MRKIICIALLVLALPAGAVTKTRYRAIQGAPINVQDFGATAGDGTDDTAAFNSALAAAPTQGSATLPGGAVVYVPPGEYNITPGQIVLPEHVTLAGAGPTATKLQVAAGTGAAIAFKEKGQVRDLWIRGNPSAPTAGSYGVANVPGVNPTLVVSHWQLERLRVSGFDVGIDLKDTWIGEVNSCTVTDNTTANVRFSVGTWETNTITVRGGELQASAAGAGVFLTGNGVNKIRLKDVTIENNAFGVLLDNSSANGLEIDGGHFEVNLSGHVVHRNGGTPRGTFITGNYFANASGTKAVYSIDIASGVEWTVERNVFAEANTTAHMRFQASTDRVHVGPNYYQPGTPFNPATDYLGTAGGLTWYGTAVPYVALDTGAKWASGTTSPQASITAPIGSLYSRTDGTITPLWLKRTGTGNTGWEAVSGERTLTYAANVAIDSSQAVTFVVTPTNGTAYTFDPPTNASLGRLINVRTVNTFGTLGAATWSNAAGGYKLAAWTQPANGFSRTITFEYNGSVWVEVTRTTADVPN